MSLRKILTNKFINDPSYSKASLLDARFFISLPLMRQSEYSEEEEKRLRKGIQASFASYCTELGLPLDSANELLEAFILRRRKIREIAKILPEYVVDVEYQLTNEGDIDVKKTIKHWLDEYKKLNFLYLNTGRQAVLDTAIDVKSLIRVAVFVGDTGFCQNILDLLGLDERCSLISACLFYNDFVDMIIRGDLVAIKWLWDQMTSTERTSILGEDGRRSLLLCHMARHGVIAFRMLFGYIADHNRLIQPDVFKTIIDVFKTIINERHFEVAVWIWGRANPEVRAKLVSYLDPKSPKMLIATYAKNDDISSFLKKIFNDYNASILPAIRSSLVQTFKTNLESSDFTICEELWSIASQHEQEEMLAILLTWCKHPAYNSEEDKYIAALLIKAWHVMTPTTKASTLKALDPVKLAYMIEFSTQSICDEITSDMIPFNKSVVQDCLAKRLLSILKHERTAAYKWLWSDDDERKRELLSSIDISKLKYNQPSTLQTLQWLWAKTESLPKNDPIRLKLRDDKMLFLETFNARNLEACMWLHEKMDADAFTKIKSKMEGNYLFEMLRAYQYDICEWMWGKFSDDERDQLITSYDRMTPYQHQAKFLVFTNLRKKQNLSPYVLQNIRQVRDSIPNNQRHVYSWLMQHAVTNKQKSHLMEIDSYEGFLEDLSRNDDELCEEWWSICEKKNENEMIRRALEKCRLRLSNGCLVSTQWLWSKMEYHHKVEMLRICCSTNELMSLLGHRGHKETLEWLKGRKKELSQGLNGTRNLSN